MPPLAHPEPLIPEHQRLAGDPMDSACSPASSSFFGKLWPNRRKFAPFSKSASVGSAQEIHDLQSKPSSISVGLKSSGQRLPRRASSGQPQSDSSSASAATQLDVRSQEAVFATLKERLHGESSDTVSFPDWAISVGNIGAGCGREGLAIAVDSGGYGREERNVSEHGREGPAGGGYCRAEGSKQEMGMKPIMESLKGVVINKQTVTDRAGEGDIGGLKEEQEQINRELAGEGGGRGGSGHALTKRCGSFEAGEVLAKACGPKKMRMSTLCELQRVAGFLRQGRSMGERWLAAEEVLRLCKDDPIARVTLGVQLGVIPSLIFMLHSSCTTHQCTALSALLNLAIGNDVNKATTVKANGLQQMLVLTQSPNVKVQAAVVSLLLSLSALDANKEDIGALGFIPALVALMHKEHTRKDALRTLYNLSINACNAKYIVEAGGVPFLLDAVSDENMAAKSLATLSNLAGTDVGRHAFGQHKEVAYTVLVDVMHRMENPKCQERAVYILMMVAHHSPIERGAMVAAGIIPVLVELSLLGSALARKRAARTLDSFRRTKAFSAPQHRQSLQMEILCSDGSHSMPRASSEKKVVDGLVKQSLYRTMQRIARRANLSMVMGEPIPSAVRPTTRSFWQGPLGRRSSSCSLPF